MTKLSQKNESPKLSFANPFDAVFEQVKDAGVNVVSERIAQKATEMYKDKPFGLEYKNTYTVTNLVAGVSGIVSFASALFALQTVLFWIVGYCVSWVGSLILCALIEVLKTQIWGKTAKNYNVYKRVSMLGVSTLFGLHVLSLVSSGYGAYIIPSQFVAPPPPVLDSVAAKASRTVLGEAENLDAQILGIDAQITKFSAVLIKPNGQKSSSTAKEITNLNAQKSELQAQKKDAILRVEQMRKEQKEQSEKIGLETKGEVLTLQYIAVGVAVLFELLYILCTLFGFYYMFRVYVDSVVSPSETNETIQKPNELVKNDFSSDISSDISSDFSSDFSKEQSPHIAPPANAKPQKIGFKFYDKESIKGEVVLPVCMNCEAEFLPKHHKQKYCCADCKNDFWEQKTGKKLPKYKYGQG